MRAIGIALLPGIGAWAVLAALGAAQAEESQPVITAAQIEADWLSQASVRQLPASSDARRATGVTPVPGAAVSTRQDAAGGCDGIKNGTYGFHTGRERDPWWQVDLGKSLRLYRVVIYNRCDGNVEERAARLKVLLSDDGNRWTELYRHDGTKFMGRTDGKPLTVPAAGASGRLVRVQLPETEYLHLDEVEIYPVGSDENVALHKSADQSSTSPWSARHTAASGTGVTPVAHPPAVYATQDVVRRGLALAESLRRLGADVDAEAEVLEQVRAAEPQAASECASHNVLPSPRLRGEGPGVRGSARDSYLRACFAVRRMALKNPLLDFNDLLFVKRVPGTFTHMSDQNYGWFSRPGGGLYVLAGFKTDTPRLRCLSGGLPEGSILQPDLSYDGQRVLFAHCKHYPGLKDEPNKLDKSRVPEDAFYHLYEINLDGSGLRRLTRGKYDDFDGRYLPDGRIAFLSTRRGQYVQCGKASGAESAAGSLPDSYVRCGGGPERPVAIYTLHAMDADGENLTQISAFENFEWTPSVDGYGRILYARWDYVDRYNMPYMSLWSTRPDGTNAQAVFGNFTRNPHCIFEARSIPASQKLIFTASGHHAFTGGCLVLLDPNRGGDGQRPMTRLTPEVMFPESEGWPDTYYASPYPLSEEHYLVAWSASPLPPGTPRPDWGMPGPPNDLGLYLFDAFGNLTLIYRDPAISSMYPLPIRPRRPPPLIGSQVDRSGQDEARLLVLNVYQGLPGGEGRGARGQGPGVRGQGSGVRVRWLRLVGVPAKTHPTMNYPVMGLTHDDPGKFVIGTVPVEEDGSAYFRVPSGVSFFVQALDQQGTAVQTMRTVTYLQPGQQHTCIGCHEPRHTAPPNVFPTAARREASKITPGPEGSWPLDYQVLVQPVLEKHCTQCHRPGGEDAEFDLTAAKSYNALVDYGKPSLREHVIARYNEGRSIALSGAAATNPLLKLLDAGHYDAKLSAEDRDRLTTWMDTYGQRLGSFDKQQEARLRQLRHSMAAMLLEQ